MQKSKQQNYKADHENNEPYTVEIVEQDNQRLLPNRLIDILTANRCSRMISEDSNQPNEPRNESFVEFNLSNSTSTSLARQVNLSSIDLQRNEKTTSSIDFSHQSAPEPVGKKQNGEDSDESDWEEMQATNRETVYDNKGKVLVQNQLIAQQTEADEQQNNCQLTSNGGSGNDKKHETSTSFAYTRIDEEKQAEKYQAIDRKTDFLFEAASTSKAKNDEFQKDDENEENFTIDKVHNETTSSSNQLETTRSLLNDTQKFAYVGLVRLVIAEMNTELMKLTLASQSLRNTGSKSSRKFIRRMNACQNNFSKWSIQITSSLYEHLELTNDEVQMIESLSKHGVSPEDLTISLLKHTGLVEKPREDSANVITDSDGQLETDKNNKIEIDITWTIICDLFLLLLTQTETYDSRSRTLIYKFTQLLGIKNVELQRFEKRITETLQLQNTSDQKWQDQGLMKSRKDKGKKKRMMYVGMATLGGALILGLSGGLLAPVIGGGIAAGLSTIGISGTAGFLAGAGGTALVTVGSTAIGARAGSRGMRKRIGEVKTFEFIPLHNNRRVNLIITVSGWMSGKADDVRLPFSTVDPVMGDLYSLLWEPEILQSTGQTMGILASEILTQSIQQILGATILAALMGAVQLPMALSKLTYLVDNPWNVSVDRAWKAGLILADTLIAKNLGDRPVTLLGFSLGSRVIYSCLLELAKRGSFGIVEDVILFGSPVVVSNDELLLVRSAVSGRFVNGYSKKDWILGYLYRATSGGLRCVAGLSPIASEELNVENFDCTELVEGHMGYRKVIPKLLKKLGFEILSEEFIEIDEPDAEETERQRKLVLEFDEVRKQMELEEKKKREPKGWSKWFKPKKKEWWQLYAESKSANGSKDNVSSLPNSTGNAPRESEIRNDKDGFDVDRMLEKVDQMQIQNGTITNDLNATDAGANRFQEYNIDENKRGSDEEDIEEDEEDTTSTENQSYLECPSQEVARKNIGGTEAKQGQEADEDGDEDDGEDEGPITMTFW